MTTYYIDFDNGNDANSGTTQNTAWKTIPGTRTVNNSGFLRTSWGGTISNANKVPAGTIFKLKSGTTYNSSDGGAIQLDNIYYLTNYTLSNPVIFQKDTTWGNGAIIIDGNGITLSQGLIQINNIGGFTFDGGLIDGIILQNSKISGIKQWNSGAAGTQIEGFTVQYMKFFHNGTTITTDTDGASEGHIFSRAARNGIVQYVTIDGDKSNMGSNGFICGVNYGDDNYTIGSYTSPIMVRNCVIHDLKGDVNTDDSGIGVKCENGTMTIQDCELYNNLKGIDLGHQPISGSQPNITYIVNRINAHNNMWGVNFNGAAQSYSGTVKFYVMNSIIRDNESHGVHVYSGPYYFYMIHNTLDNNAIGTLWERSQLQIGANNLSTWDNSHIEAYVYNNIFYKPGGGTSSRNFINYYWSKNSTDINIMSDYNSWIQNTSEPFADWGALYPSDDGGQFLYGTNGPGHASGNWYNYYGYSSTPPSTGQIGHYHNDDNSKGTGATDTTLPPFTNVYSHNYNLTKNYKGINLSTKSWYITEMGIDILNNLRSSWDIGAFEFTNTICPEVQASFELIII